MKFLEIDKKTEEIKFGRQVRRLPISIFEMSKETRLSGELEPRSEPELRADMNS